MLRLKWQRCLRSHRAFTLIEVLVSLAILLGGVLPIVWFYSRILRERADAEMLTRGTLLAQMKAEEIRRDDDLFQTMYNAIAAKTTPTTPIEFPIDADLSYSFCGKSLIYVNPETQPPLSDPGVARVIIVKTVRSSAAIEPKDVVYELRFGP